MTTRMLVQSSTTVLWAPNIMYGSQAYTPTEYICLKWKSRVLPIPNFCYIVANSLNDVAHYSDIYILTPYTHTHTHTHTRTHRHIHTP